MGKWFFYVEGRWKMRRMKSGVLDVMGLEMMGIFRWRDKVLNSDQMGVHPHRGWWDVSQRLKGGWGGCLPGVRPFDSLNLPYLLKILVFQSRFICFSSP